MITSWMLYFFIGGYGSHSPETIAIPNLISYQECVRVEAEMRSLSKDYSSVKTKCIEVRTIK